MASTKKQSRPRSLPVKRSVRRRYLSPHQHAVGRVMEVVSQHLHSAARSVRTVEQLRRVLLVTYNDERFWEGITDLHSAIQKLQRDYC